MLCGMYNTICMPYCMYSDGFQLERFVYISNSFLISQWFAYHNGLLIDHKGSRKKRKDYVFGKMYWSTHKIFHFMIKCVKWNGIGMTRMLWKVNYRTLSLCQIHKAPCFIPRFNAKVVQTFSWIVSILPVKNYISHNIICNAPAVHKHWQPF